MKLQKPKNSTKARGGECMRYEQEKQYWRDYPAVLANFALPASLVVPLVVFLLYVFGRM